jgi:hypothetical protein
MHPEEIIHGDRRSLENDSAVGEHGSDLLHPLF